MEYKKLFCVKCGKKHTNPDGWSHRKWEVAGEVVEGWGCHRVEYYEFVPDRIKEDRKRYAKDLVQPFRSGEFSREFKESYPDQTRQMVKDGSVSKKEVDRAKDVWK